MLKHMMDPLWLLQANQCKLDEVRAPTKYRLDFLSTNSLLEYSDVLAKFNRPPEWQWSKCGGSLDWSWLLVPSADHHFRTADDAWND